MLLRGSPNGRELFAEQGDNAGPDGDDIRSERRSGEGRWTSSRGTITLFEPQAGVPVSDQPLLRELLARPGWTLRSPAPWLAARWTMLRVTAEGPPTVYGSRTKVALLATTPHGEEIRLVVSGPLALVAATYESGYLWLVGESYRKRKMTAGMPEVPAVGNVRRQ